MSLPFSGMTTPNRISTLSYSVARVRAQLAVANRMCSEMFCDRRSVIPTPAFSSTVSSSWAVTHCNRAGTMATTLGFTASNICGGWLRARRRNEPSCQNSNRARTLMLQGRLCRPHFPVCVRHARYYDDFAGDTPASTSESSRAKAMCLRHVDRSIDLVAKPAREGNHPA